VNVNYVPNIDESGVVRGIIVLTHDITESKLDRRCDPTQ
jgi:signal transduction histidine kinase